MLTQGLEQVIGVVGVVGAEIGVVVLADLRRRREVLGLRDVVRAAHADEVASGQRIVAVLLVTERLDQRRDVVRVAGDDLDESIFARLEHLVVDAAGVRHAEAELAALRQKALGSLDVVVVLRFHLVAGGSAVDHHGRAGDRLFGLVRDGVPHLLERVALIFVGGEPGAARHQVLDLRAVRRERCPLVEGHFVDTHPIPEVGVQPDQRLADRASADDVDDRLLHGPSSRATKGRRGAVARRRKKRSTAARLGTRARRLLRSRPSPPRARHDGLRRAIPDRGGRRRRSRGGPRPESG